MKKNIFIPLMFLAVFVLSIMETYSVASAAGYDAHLVDALRKTNSAIGALTTSDPEGPLAGEIITAKRHLVNVLYHLTRVELKLALADKLGVSIIKLNVDDSFGDPFGDLEWPFEIKDIFESLKDLWGGIELGINPGELKIGPFLLGTKIIIWKAISMLRSEEVDAEEVISVLEAAKKIITQEVQPRLG